MSDEGRYILYDLLSQVLQFIAKGSEAKGITPEISQEIKCEGNTPMSELDNNHSSRRDGVGLFTGQGHGKYRGIRREVQRGG